VLHQQGRIGRLGRKMAACLRYTSDELVGRAALEIVHPDDRPYIEGRIHSVYEQMPVVEAAQRLIRSDGSIAFVVAIGFPVTWREGPAALTFFRPMRD
jgi:PAS domain S-box-containing protein